MVNNQQTKSSITVNYTTTSGKLISSIKDGAGRVYTFHYNSSYLLSKISYVGTGNTELSFVSFGYSGSNLVSITDKDGKVCNFTYTTNNLLSSAQDIDGYKLSYTYNTVKSGQPSRIKTISETDGNAAGGSLSIEYSKNQTTFTDYSGNVQIMQFNNFGNTVSIQDNQGRAQYAQYAINDPDENSSDSTAKGNQLRLSSKMQNTVGNVLDDGSFENGTVWKELSTLITGSVTTAEAYTGNKSLMMVRDESGALTGLMSSIIYIPAGETYTFSAYVKTVGGSALLVMTGGGKWEYSETLRQNTDWTRLEVSYTNETDKSVGVSARVETNDAGTTYMDCVQVEKAPTASRYNLVENGDFRYSTFWDYTVGLTNLTSGTAPAPELNSNVYRITGSPTVKRRLSQTVQVSGNKDDVFVLSGWAKGNSAPLEAYDTTPREFGLIAVFNYTDGTTGTNAVHFNDCIDNWQYAAKAIIAERDYSSIKIQVAYDYNVNRVYFDGIQLFKEEFGSSYTYDKDGNVISVKDLQAQTTTYEYKNNNLTKEILPTGAKLTYTYDSYHNVKTATTESGVVYTFAYDAYGNNTSVSIGSGTSKITSTATYTSDGNRLASTTDAAGKVTTYSYNADTNVLEWVKYPEDSEATRTNYTYDSMYRLASAAATTDQGSALTASYTYSDDLLTQIKTGSTTYSFSYGDFALRSNIKIGNRTLASYSYTDRTNYLSSLDYGNGDGVDYTYDKQGRVTSQTYEDGSTVTYKYDNSGALATVTDSATGITRTYIYDTTNRLLKYKEKSSSYTHIADYGFDDINNLTQLHDTIRGTVYKTNYSYDKENRITQVKDGSLVARNYTYDTYGRTNQTVTKYGTRTILTTTYGYRNPGSTQTTGQVASLALASTNFNTTLSYTYDDNGNILTVSDGTNTTSYVYDTANQLIRENNQAGNFTHVWTYDDAGNITKREEYAYTTGTLGAATDTVNYTYGDSEWGDLLTAYDGQTITHDGIGNPLTDGTWTYTWERGRQLASMTDGTTTWEYTYNTDGMRIGRTNGTKSYTYYYNGDDLRYMALDNHTLYFVLDADGQALEVTYKDGTSTWICYYVRNLQGDVIAILDHNNNVVVEYTYDAWGNVLSVTGSMADTLGQLNPFRYRGYVYDTETGLYYLQSRYYNPEMGRFINADTYASTGQGVLGYNMFAYCDNNPTNSSDPTGEFALGLVLGKAALGAAVNVLTTYIGAKVTGQSYSWKDAGVAAISGALGTGNTVFKVAAGVVSGVYSGVMARKNGASKLGAMTAGLISALGTTASVANIAGWTGTNLSLGVSTVVDVIFGTSANTMAAVTYRVSIENSVTNTNSRLSKTLSANRTNCAKLVTEQKLLY